MVRFDVEQELVDFNLDKMHVKARENLLKVANLLGQLDIERWQDFIEDGAINATAVIKEAEISRSSYYQNQHIVAYLQKKAEWLFEQEALLVAPYQARENSSDSTRTPRYSPLEKVIKEKDLMIRQLQIKVAELESHLESMKQECHSLKQHSHSNQKRSELLELFKRVPR